MNMGVWKSWKNSSSLSLTFLGTENKMVDVYYPEYPLGGVVMIRVGVPLQHKSFVLLILCTAGSLVMLTHQVKQQ